MDIKLHLQHPDEMEAFATFLTASAESRRKRPQETRGVFGLGGIDRTAGLWSGPLDYADGENASVTREAEDLTPEPVEDDKPKRTRRSKAQIEADNAANETVANLDPEVVATAEAAGVHVQGPAAALIDGMSDEEFNRDRSDENPNVGKSGEDEPELPMGQEQADQPTLTENDVRNAIIDLLNEAQAKFPDDADVRTKTLAPILKTLGAEKISKIAATEYARVPGILADARAALEAALKEAA